VTAHARIKCTIWRDEDFRDLGVDAQWLYQRLLSDSSRNHAGVLALTRKRWVGSARGMTHERLDDALAELALRTFIVVDEDTEEVLVRTYVRHNDVASQPNVLKAALRQAGEVESPTLRAALAYELRLLPEKPADTERMTYPDPHAVAEAIDPGQLGARLSVVRDAKGSSKGSANPSANPGEKEKEKKSELVGGGAGGELITPQQLPLVAEIVKPAQSRGTRLAEEWRPSPNVQEWSREFAGRVDITAEWAKFQDYWLAKPGAAGRKTNWDATWRNWLRRADERRAERSASRTRSVKDERVAAAIQLGQQMAQAREGSVWADPPRKALL
jgi:hypothetical protein